MTIAEKKRMWFSLAALGSPVVPEVKMCSAVSEERQPARAAASTGGAPGAGRASAEAKGGVTSGSRQTKRSG